MILWDEAADKGMGRTLTATSMHLDHSAGTTLGLCTASAYKLVGCNLCCCHSVGLSQLTICSAAELIAFESCLLVLCRLSCLGDALMLELADSTDESGSAGL